MAGLATTTDLTQLPLRALVAFAVRCARRVQPRFSLSLEHEASETCQSAVDEAIRVAELFAAGEPVEPGLFTEVEERIVQTILVATRQDADGAVGALVANSAYAAISCAKAAFEAFDAPDAFAASESVVNAANTAFDAAMAADPAVERAAHLDWDMLHRMALGKFPGHGEPIDPAPSGILGPLFCGSPPEQSEDGCDLDAELDASQGADPDAGTDDTGRTSSISTKQSGVSKKVRDGAATLRRQQADLEHDRAALKPQRQTIETKQKEFERERAAFREEHAKLKAEMQAACEMFAEKEQQAREQQERLTEERARLEAAVETLKRERLRIERERSALEKDRSRKDAEKTADLSRERAQLEVKQAELEAELAAVGHERMQLQEQEALLQADRVQFEQRRNQTSTSSSELERERQKLAQARKQLRVQRAALKSGHEKLAVKSQALKSQEQKFEDELRKFRSQRGRSRRRPGLLARMRLASARNKLQSLHRARTTWSQERKQLLAELADLRAAQRGQSLQDVSVPNSGQTAAELPDATPPPAVRILIEPGSASVGQIGDLLSEITMLYQNLGGPGLRFEVRDCRLRRTLRTDKSSEPDSGYERGIVEVHAVPSAPASGPQVGWDLVQWDRLRACLMVPFKRDNGLSEDFDGCDRAPRRHAARRLIADAVQHSYDKDAQRQQGNESTDSAGLAIDSVSRRLNRIEDLIKDLVHRRHFVLELADDCPTAESTAPSASLAGPVADQPSPKVPRSSLTWNTIISVTAGSAVVTGLKLWQTLGVY